MTDEEIKVITETVIDQIKKDSVNIDELTQTNALSLDDMIELNKGRKVSLEDLRTFIRGFGIFLEIITKNDDTIPTDSNVFSALRTLQEIVDNNEKLKKIFLRKDQEDQTNFLLKILGGIISPFLKSPDFVTGMMGAGMSFSSEEGGESVGWIDKLYVRKKAIFQVLSIMETELAGASFMFNASGARATITKVERIDAVPFFYSDGSAKYYSDGSRAYVQPSVYGAVYRCYFLTDDGEKAIENRFRVGNLVRSQTFNIQSGVYENVSNHYWWRLVTAVGKDWIEVSDTHCDEGSDVPAVGDVMVQLGDISDTDFQAAVVLSAYGDGAPYLTFYQGINSYSLSGRDVFTIGYDRLKKECYVNVYGRTYIGERDNTRYFDLSGGKLKIKADSFIFSTGESVSDKFNELGERISAEIKIVNDEISLGLSDLDDKITTEIKAINGAISLKVDSSKLLQTGIDIDKKTVTVTADKFFVKDLKGNQIAVFTTDSEGKPLIKADYIDTQNLKVKFLDGATGSFTGSLLTNSSGKRIFINPDTRSIQLILPDNNVISEWAFFELNGYQSCTLKLFNNGGENLILYPHIMQIRQGSNVQLNAEPDALTLVNGSNRISIRANQITMSDGNNYTGYTGSVTVMVSSIKTNTLYFKNGICYKIE